MPANPNNERLVVWNETEQKLEDVIKSPTVEIREEQNANPLSATRLRREFTGSMSIAHQAKSPIR